MLETIKEQLAVQVLKYFLEKHFFQDYKDFRIDNIDQRKVIDALVQEQVLYVDGRREDERIALSLKGLYQIDSSESKQVLKECNELLPALKKLYISTKGREHATLEQVAQLLKKEVEQLKVPIFFLARLNFWSQLSSDSSGIPTDFVLKEEVLDLDSVESEILRLYFKEEELKVPYYPTGRILGSTDVSKRLKTVGDTEDGDVKKLRRILDLKGHSHISALLKYSWSKLEISDSYGSKLFSQISTFEIHSPIEMNLKLKSLTDVEKEEILQNVLEIYPVKDHSPEVREVVYITDFDLIVEPESIANGDFSAILKPGHVIDGKYRLESMAKAQGGMGKVLFVRSILDGKLMALKLCTSDIKDIIKRFKREVKILKKYKGNEYVVQVLADNLDHSPPYFVMEYAAYGDLTSIIPKTSTKLEEQKKVFDSILKCVYELHKNNDIHRDIKPHNFLILEDGKIVVSDFGLAKDPVNSTQYTVTGSFGGTQDYAPPEFFEGDFKNAKIPWDIFSIGKTMYEMVTGRNPRFFSSKGVDPALYKIISKCCENIPEERYQSLSQLEAALNFYFDLRLDTKDAEINFINKYKSLQAKIEGHAGLSAEEASGLISAFLRMIPDEQRMHVEKLFPQAVARLTEKGMLQDGLLPILDAYEKFCDEKFENKVNFAFAEGVVSDMNIIYRSDVTPILKSKALEIAVYSSIACNRFAAMDRCTRMITEIEDDMLAQYVVDWLGKYQGSFVGGIAPAECSNQIVKMKIKELSGKK